MKYGNVTGEIFADAFAVCRARMRKTAKKLPAPSRMYRGGRESRAGKPRQSRRRAGKLRQSPPPAEQPTKARRRAGKPLQSLPCAGSPAKAPPCGEAPPKRPLEANRAEYKKAAGRMTRRLRGLYSSACSKLTFLLLWLYNTVRMCRFCDETETLRLQLRTGLVKLLRCRFYLL